MNIFKELKIEIIKTIKFLIRICKRTKMFVFFISFALIYTLVYFNHLETNIFLHIASFSIAMVLTLTFLYIIDLIKATKKFFEDKAEERKFKKFAKTMTKVTISSK